MSELWFDLADGSADLDRRAVYDILVDDGSYAGVSFTSFTNDVKVLDLRDRFRDARRDNKGRPPDELTVGLKRWLVENMARVQEEEGAVTVRRVYYILLGEAAAWFGPGVFAKDERNYAKVSSELARLRRARVVPYEWIVESGRGAVLNNAHEWDVLRFVESALDPWTGSIERDPWREARDRCEIWFEKDTVGHVFAPACASNRVAMVSCHGMSSLTLLREAVERIHAHNRQGRPVTVYYLGDLDKSGLDIANNVRDDLANHGDAELDWDFVHLGVHPEQVREHGFLTHPRKKAANEKNPPDWAPSGWDRDTVCELDAAPPVLLRGWTEAAIRNHLTEEMVERNAAIEREWRDEAEDVVREIRERCSDIMERYGVG